MCRPAADDRTAYLVLVAPPTSAYAEAILRLAPFLLFPAPPGGTCGAPLCVRGVADRAAHGQEYP